MLSHLAAFTVIGITGSSAIQSPSQEPSLTDQAQTFKRVLRKEVEGSFLVALPEGYGRIRSQRWPLILFLHGSGERGSDVQQVAVHGPIKEIRRGRKIPMIVVAPQCPEGQWWDADTLTGLLDHMERKYRVDRNRIYLTGLSMGGFGTWDLAIRSPQRFAAIAPICGGGEPRRARVLKDIPTWVVHGDRDPAVPLQQSVEMVEALRKAGGNVRFDIIQGGGHDVWTDVYANPAFYEWLLSQKRG